MGKVSERKLPMHRWAMQSVRKEKTQSQMVARKPQWWRMEVRCEGLRLL